MRYGPFVKVVEAKVFKLKYFVKYIPVSDRPAWLRERFHRNGWKVYETDYVSFESHFYNAIQKSVEYVLMQYMCQNLPSWSLLQRLLELKMGRQRIMSKLIHLMMDAVKCSGEMDTSLSNGFTNLMVMMQAMEDMKITEYETAVEGDDGALGTPQYDKFDFNYFEERGWRMKCVSHDNIGMMSFCGMVFEPDSLQVIGDPTQIMLKFGWTQRCYLHSRQRRLDQLLVAKAYSYIYQYPDCPIIGFFAFMILSTIGRKQHISLKGLEWYESKLAAKGVELYGPGKHLPIPKPTMATRFLFEKKYDYSIAEQLDIESMFLNMSRPVPWTHPVVLRHCGPDLIDCNRYVADFSIHGSTPLLQGPRNNRTRFSVISDFNNRVKLAAQDANNTQQEERAEKNSQSRSRST